MDKVGDSAQQILNKIHLQFLSQYFTIAPKTNEMVKNCEEWLKESICNANGMSPDMINVSANEVKPGVYQFTITSNTPVVVIEVARKPELEAQHDS